MGARCGWETEEDAEIELLVGVGDAGLILSGSCGLRRCEGKPLTCGVAAMLVSGEDKIFTCLSYSCITFLLTASGLWRSAWLGRYFGLAMTGRSASSRS